MISTDTDEETLVVSLLLWSCQKFPFKSSSVYKPRIQCYDNESDCCMIALVPVCMLSIPSSSKEEYWHYWMSENAAFSLGWSTPEPYTQSTPATWLHPEVFLAFLSFYFSDLGITTLIVYGAVSTIKMLLVLSTTVAEHIQSRHLKGTEAVVLLE